MSNLGGIRRCVTGLGALISLRDKQILCSQTVSQPLLAALLLLLLLLDLVLVLLLFAIKFHWFEATFVRSDRLGAKTSEARIERSLSLVLTSSGRATFWTCSCLETARRADRVACNAVAELPNTATRFDSLASF